jgi:hypothetical protein
MLMALLIYGRELQTKRNRRWPFEAHTRCAIALPVFSAQTCPASVFSLRCQTMTLPARIYVARRRVELLGEAKARQEARSHGTEALARPARRVRRTQREDDSLLKMLNRPQVWTLNILAWLMLYPSVTRKALKTFDCVQLLGERYLRSDPAIRSDELFPPE